MTDLLDANDWIGLIRIRDDKPVSLFASWVKFGGCMQWFRKRTNMEKTLLSFSSVLLLTLLLIILVGVTFHGTNSNSSSEEGGTCWTQECIHAAGEMLSSMNLESDSCTSFYDFACGRYGFEPGQSSSSEKRSKDLVNSSLRRILESEENIAVNGLKDLRSFYHTCVQFGNHRLDSEATRKVLLNLMHDLDIGDWPMIDSNYDFLHWSVNRTLAKLTLLGIPVAFRMDIVPDKHTGIYLLKISPGGPRESGRSPDDIKSNIQLRSSILTPLIMVAESAGKSITDVDDILSVDSKFAMTQQARNASCDVVLIPPDEVDSELKRLLYNVEWTVILTEIRKATGIVWPFAVQLHCRKEIRDYMEHLHRLTDRSAANYLGWRFFSAFVDHVVPTSGEQQGLNEGLPRFRACMNLLQKFAKPLLAEVFTRKMISDKFEAQAEKIFNDVVRSTQRLVSRAGWLSQSQRAKISEKVFWFIDKFPFKSGSYGTLAAINLPRVNVSNFTAAIVYHQMHVVVERFQKLAREGMESEIDKYFVIPEDLSTVLPPFFRPDVPQWINFGGFGVFVARQISRFIVSAGGATPTNNSTVWDLWMKNSKYHKCISDSELASLNDTVKSHLLLERFLDHSSIEIALESAQSSSGSGSLPGLDMSSQKLFFLSHAQTLCDATSYNSTHRKQKVDSVVSTFKEVFGCESSPVRCQIWA